MPFHQYWPWNKLQVQYTPKCPNSSWACLIMIFCNARCGSTHTCPFSHMFWRFCPSQWYIWALWKTQSFSLDDNPTSNSLLCRPRSILEHPQKCPQIQCHQVLPLNSQKCLKNRFEFDVISLVNHLPRCRGMKHVN
jgi:hypothetical protein